MVNSDGEPDKQQLISYSKDQIVGLKKNVEEMLSTQGKSKKS